MEQFVELHALGLKLVISAVIASFLAMGAYAISRNPHRVVSWIFGLMCLAIAGIYLSSVFLVVVPSTVVTSEISLFFLRFKWVMVAVGAALYLHLVTGHFPGGWRRYRRICLGVSYLAAAVAGGLILFTNTVIAGVDHQDYPHTLNPLPGPLIWVIIGVVVAQLLCSVLGLGLAGRVAVSASQRHQSQLLLAPTILVVAAFLLYWLNLLFGDVVDLPHEIADSLLLLAALLAVRVPVWYGVFLGRFISRQKLLKSVLFIGAGLLLLNVAFALDSWLVAYTRLSFPLFTGGMAILAVISYPLARQQFAARLDRQFFQFEHRQEQLLGPVLDALAESPEPEQLQTRFLDTLCILLDTQRGFVAVAQPSSRPGVLAVQAVFGDILLKPGAEIRSPSKRNLQVEPQWVYSVPELAAAPGWQGIEFFCVFALDRDVTGVVALGERRAGRPYSWQDLTLVATAASQLNHLGRLSRLYRSASRPVSPVQPQNQVPVSVGNQAVLAGEPPQLPPSEPAPIELKVLGSMQLYRAGALVSEKEWGSEKAKLLLAYLLWKLPMGASRAELCHALWPELDDKAAANVFHVTLHRLRRVLQPDPKQNRASPYILHDRGQYRFNSTLPHRLDADLFRQMLEDSRLAVIKGALTLYRGSYLEDVAWALPPDVGARQRWFEQLYADALRKLINQATPREKTLYLEQLLLVEPADEAALRALTLAYLAQGRRDLATRQVSRWQQALIDVDLEPTPETTELWATIQAG